MQEAVVGSVIGATIRVVLQNLLPISIEEFNLFRDFKKDLKKLRDSFLTIQDFLDDAEMQQVRNKAVNRWLKKLESMAFKADNVFDELNYHILHNQNQNNMMKEVKTFFTRSNRLAFRLKMVRKIKDINKELESIYQDANKFGLQVKPVGATSEVVAGRETDPFTADPIVLAREDDVSKIVEMLTTSPAEQVFSVLPIVGMGGLGKTTLARLVFNHEKIKAQFEKQIWVYVSSNFDAKILFKKILESLTRKSIQFENRGVVLKELQEELSTKRYLLVLDDLWNESREDWDDFLYSLSGISSVMGNSMIVTTRGENIASIVKTLPMYKLKGLSEDDCWSVIKAKAFGEAEVPSELEMNGRIIANRCQGLPLAAKVVGGLLCDKSKEEWLVIEKTWLSNNFGEDKNVISKILKVSFDHLSLPSLKKCFAYCSIFPKGFRIRREQLIELWMAEGFLTTDQNNDIEAVGNKFFNRLVQNSLLQDVKRDNFGDITDCNMHDLVHDLAIQFSSFKNNCVSENSLDDIYQVRYIQLESIRDDPLLMPKQQARCVRTLFFNGKVSDNMLLDFKSLHALVLMSHDVKELLSLIRKLIHLRLLDISNTRIEYLPDWIGKLYHLQTLRAGDDLRRLPHTLKYLSCLMHLHIPKIELPPEIGKLTSLRTLPFLKVGHGKGCRIGELGGLKNLKGEVEICNLERVNDKEEAESARLFQKPNICKLKFAWDESRESEINDENVLEGLQPHPNLKSLEIYGYKGQGFPFWTSKMELQIEGRWIRLDNLMEIRLTRCRECEELPTLGHLPHLKFLYLNGLINVSSIGPSFYGIERLNTSTSNGGGKNMIILFPALKSLELLEMPNLGEWVEVEFPAVAETQICEILIFPQLERLVIANCSKLMSAPSHFPSLKVFEIGEMDSASPLANVCGRNLISLTELKIHGVSELVCLPDALISNNRNLSYMKLKNCPNLTHLVPSLRGGGASLRKLRIDYCPNFRELPHDLHTLSSIEKLDIRFCSSLKSIPYASGEQSHEGLTSLHCLRISWCKALTHLPSEMLESCAAALRFLYLIGLSSLTNLPMVIGCLKNMPGLRRLAIIDVPKLTDFSTEIGPLHSLETLQIGAFSSDVLDYIPFQEFLNNLFRGLQSLWFLQVFGMEHWNSLPDQLQCLTALSRLIVVGFGIEALPEWLGNMSSLHWIRLIQCKTLRYFPSKEAMQRLTKLIELDIYNCPLLKVQRFNEQQSNDSQWPNISHIPRVLVDGRKI